jgi:hypothetical protein
VHFYSSPSIKNPDRSAVPGRPEGRPFLPRTTRDHRALLSLRADSTGFATLALAHALDSLVRVQDGSVNAVPTSDSQCAGSRPRREARSDASGHRLPVPTRRLAPTPQPSAQRAHTSNPQSVRWSKPRSRLRGWGWIPTRGPVERMLHGLPPPSELALARQSRGRTRIARKGNKLTNWGAPRPHA